MGSDGEGARGTTRPATLVGVFCSNCGHQNQAGAGFCSSCGTLLAAGSEATAVFHAVDPSVDLDEAEARAAEAATAPGVPELVVKRGPDVGARFSLGADVTRVGRHPESEILLDDVTVSRRHAEFLAGGPGVVVRDVGSLNGTYVNRERIEETTLADGDEVQIGRFKLLFRSAATTGHA
jgi:hypothetical protein